MDAGVIPCCNGADAEAALKLRLTALAIPAAILFAPGLVQSCGPYIESALFTTAEVAFPGGFASGELGVLSPDYSHSDLLMAYRTLSGIPLDSNETPAPAWGNIPQDSASPWLAARNQLPGVTPISHLDIDSKVPGDEFESYTNCLPPAFVNAADTLQNRVATWGANSPQLTEWLRGQDTVFENCAGGPAIPARLPQAEPLLAADRDYQIAAAEFYARQFEKAEADFDRIAADTSSPWHDISAYIAARVCIRQATLGKNNAKLLEADARLRAIANDPARGKLCTSAQDLLNFVRARTDPNQRLTELAAEAMQPKLGDRLSDDLADYTDIWYHMQSSGHLPAAGKSEVTDWILAIQHGGDNAAKWRAKPTLPWLLAALMWTKSDDPDLIDAARAVKPASPAYATAAYYGIRRQIQAGQTDAARTWTDEALQQNAPPQVSNLFRAERFYLAQNWTEFLRFAPRTPVASDLGPVPPNEAGKPAFDLDAAQLLNTTVPLRLWSDATHNNLMPRNLQTQLAQAGWTRAIILNDRNTASAFAQRLAILKPELATDMRKYLAEPDPAAAHFDAIFLMLHAPGFEPRLRPGWGRETPVLRHDIFRDNWWALDSPQSPGDLLNPYLGGKFISAAISAPQREAGNSEWSKIMQRAANGVDYLCSETLAWAKAHPDDARVPQALYLAVEATHYGPWQKAGPNSKNEWSKQAFTLLHSRYPASQWAAKTKYWY